MTPLSAARIAGEVGLAGGTITSSTYAIKYVGQVNDLKAKVVKDVEKVKGAQVYASSIEIEAKAIKACLDNSTQTKDNCVDVTKKLLASIERLKTGK